MKLNEKTNWKSDVVPENLGYIRCDKIQVGDFILPHQMGLNKRTMLVIDIEPIGERLFIKVEFLDDDYPTCPPIPREEIPGNVIRIDTTKDNKFPVARFNQ